LVTGSATSSPNWLADSAEKATFKDNRTKRTSRWITIDKEIYNSSRTLVAQKREITKHLRQWKTAANIKI
jgi:hypothetical protein